jgi:hypothetical protein
MKPRHRVGANRRSWSPGELSKCSACAFETRRYAEAKDHQKRTRTLWQKLGDTTLMAVGAIILMGVPLFLAYVVFSAVAENRDNPSLTPGYTGQIVEPPIDSDPLPPGLEADIEREARHEAAVDYCEQNSLEDFDGAPMPTEDCVEAVDEGAVDPFEGREPDYPEPDYGYP